MEIDKIENDSLKNFKDYLAKNNNDILLTKIDNVLQDFALENIIERTQDEEKLLSREEI